VPLLGCLNLLAHLLDGNPVLSFGRNLKSLGRYLYGFLCIGRLDGPKMFRTLADDIDTPARHLHALGEVLHQHIVRVVINAQGGCMQTGGVKTLNGEPAHTERPHVR
jgi:hypothetical protein